MKMLSKRHTLALILALLAVPACSGTEPGEGGKQWQPHEMATVSNGGVTLTISYDSSAERFDGTMTNTTNSTVANVRVEIHLSNGTELGPTPRVNIEAGQSEDVTLNASGQTFSWYSVHVEVGSSSS